MKMIDAHQILKKDGEIAIVALNENSCGDLINVNYVVKSGDELILKETGRWDKKEGD